MNKQDSKKYHKGEKGLANLITFIPNHFWKRAKIGIFKSIKKNPHDFVKNKELLSDEEKLELDQYFSIEIICESVSYSELLGAYLLVFSKKDPVVQKMLLKYNVGEVVNLFKNLENQNIEGIAKIIGYPSLSEFEPNLNNQEEIIKDFRQSLLNIKEELKRIAKFYLEHREFYNDYKHGFRIFPTTSSPSDSTTFGITVQIKDGEILNQAILYTKDILDKKAEEALHISNRITQILDVLIPVFRERFVEDKKTFSLRFFGIPENKKDKYLYK